MSWLGGIFQSSNLPVSEISSWSPFSSCFSHTERNHLPLAKGWTHERLPSNPMYRAIDLRISIVVSFRILPTRTISLFFVAVTESTCAFRFWRQQRCASLWFTVHLHLTWPCSIPGTKKTSDASGTWSIQAFLGSSAAKCCELMFAKLFVFTFAVSAGFVARDISDHVSGLIGLTDSFRTTAAGCSVLPQRLSYDIDSQCQSVFLVFSCFF